MYVISNVYNRYLGEESQLHSIRIKNPDTGDERILDRDEVRYLDANLEEGEELAYKVHIHQERYSKKESDQGDFGSLLSSIARL